MNSCSTSPSSVDHRLFTPMIDVKTYPEAVDVVLVEGAVANEDHLEMIHKVRRNTRVLVSFGDCAVTGNVTALRNSLGSAEPVLRRSYLEQADLQPQIPRETRDRARCSLTVCSRLHAVVKVDHYLPGLPAAGPAHPRGAGAASRRRAGPPGRSKHQIWLSQQ